jgi:ribose/xylose/arabinose/galactoside ABC-type transport system permease subunit
MGTVDRGVTSAVSAAPGTRTRLRTIVQSHHFERWAFPTALALLIALGLAKYSEFRTLDNVRNVLTFSAVPLVVALGETLVVLGRGVDLSAGSMVGLSGAIFAKLYTGGLSLWPAFFATLAIGLALGVLANGAIITKLRISFLIVTLGTFSIFRSQVEVLLNGQSVTIFSNTLDTLANGRTGGVPNIVLLAGAIYVATLVLLRVTVYGRSLYAVGANPEAARLAGINVDRIIILAYGFSAALAALAGLLLVGQLGSAQPSSGVGMELTAIAAVLLGGTRFSGGYGGVTRTLLGVLFLGVLNNILFIGGVSSFWQGTASGLVLIAAVAIDRSRRD